MDRITGNFMTQENKGFPLDCETLDCLQSQSVMTAILGNMAGDKVVLTGCEPRNEGTYRDAGYLFLRTKENPNGEILRWEGGPTANGMYIKQEYLEVTANNVNYPKAYTRRSVVPGLGDEHYDWEEFVDLRTLKELAESEKRLKTELENMRPAEPGIIQMWGGSSVPDGYLLCNGQSVKKDDYPTLYEALGDTFNRASDANGGKYTTADGEFRVPDLRGRFVVGWHDSDNDYKVPGSAGGEKTVTLTKEQMPGHVHSLKDYYYPESPEQAKGNYDIIEANSKVGSKGTDDDNNCLHYIEHDTESAGDSKAHENRPPYYVLAYIIRAK